MLFLVLDTKVFRCALCCMVLCALVGGQAHAGSSYSTTLKSGVNIGVVGSVDNVLAPDYAASQSGNTITLGDGSDTDPYYVFGGLDVQSTNSATATGNTVTISGGAIASNPSETTYSASATGGMAYSDSGSSVTANGNNITLNSITIEGALIGGWGSMTGDNGTATANNNTVLLNNGTVNGAFGVTGGWATTYGASSTASDNSVTITGGTVISDSGVAAGWAEVFDGPGTATSNNNSLTMSSGTVSGGISGSSATGGLVGGYALKNSYFINSSGDAVASGNHVTMSGGTVDDGGGVVGGWAKTVYSLGAVTVTANDNSVVVSGGTIGRGGEIYGGWAREHNSQDGHGNVVATGNSVTISNVTMAIRSGAGTMGDGANVFGGWGRTSSLSVADGNGTVTGNSLTMTSGTVGGGLFGGYIYGYNGESVAANNTVNLSGGSVGTSVYGGWAYGEEGVTQATGNNVTISGGTVTGNVYGGHAVATTAIGTATATGNTVTISGTPSFGAASTLYGGYATINGAVRNDYASVIKGNTLNIASQIAVKGAQNFENWNFVLKDSFKSGTMLTVTDAVTLGAGAKVGLSVDSASGALAKNDTFNLISNVADTYTPSSTTLFQQQAGFLNIYDFEVKKEASNALTAKVKGLGQAGGYGNGNTFTISSGSYSDHDYLTGGFADGTTASTATGNTLSLSGNPTFGTDSVLYGGYASSGVTGDVRTGNTLEVRNVGLSAKNVQNFQNFRFYLPATINANDTMLTLSDVVDIRAPSGGAATTVGVGIMGRGMPLAMGDSVTLIKSAVSLTADGGMKNTAAGMQGISSVYEFDLLTTATELQAKVSRVSKSDESILKSPSEGKAASVTLVTQGADLISGQGMSNAREAAKAAGARAVGLSVAGFGAVNGGASTYKTGSHVDVKGFSFMAGLAKRLPLSGVDALAGVFFEAGFGSYDSYNRRADGGDIKGWGNSRYFGGGLMGRLEWTEGAVKGLYTEVSTRMGGLHSDYKSDDLNPTLGRADYDISSTYYGLHAGMGYIWQLTDKANLDLYGKYYWTHTTGSDVRILGDKVEFDAVNSHRTRVGGRFSYVVNDYITPFVGAAWEYEFDGSTRSTVAGQSVAAPSLKGSTGVGELGINWKPAANSNFSIDLGTQGYVGMRQGVSGSLQLKFEF